MPFPPPEPPQRVTISEWSFVGLFFALSAYAAAVALLG